MKRKAHGHFWSIAVLGIVAGLYFLSGASSAQAVIQSSGPVYRMDEGVFLQCVVRWNSSVLPDLLDEAEELGAPVNFFVSPRWAEEQPELLGRMHREGHSVGILLAMGSERSVISQLNRGRSALEKAGFDGGLSVLPERDGDAFDLQGMLRGQNVQVLLCSFDVQGKTSRAEDLVQRIQKDSFAGAIIRFEPTKTMLEALKGAVEALRAQKLEPRAIRAPINSNPV